jgi:DNA-binding NarL/FixJ family response regulator
MVLGLLTDLFFSARIRETAKQLGVPCEILRDPAVFVDRVIATPPRLVIVDMNLKGADAAAVVRNLRARAPDVTVIGYLYDAQEELMLAAEEAGCHQVLSRGQLTRKLPELLKA